MDIASFDFELPPHLIAQAPLRERSASRLMKVDSTGSIQDCLFKQFPTFFNPGDLLIFNNTRVMKCRLLGKKDSGGNVELLIERVEDDHHVWGHLRSSKKIKPNSTFYLEEVLPVKVLKERDGLFLMAFDTVEPIEVVLDKYGRIPLPPYIDRVANQNDEERYQTIFAHHLGAVAAPTAGLHFDKTMLELLRQKGVIFAEITLHIGSGTFRPIRTTIDNHIMHAEHYEIPQETILKIYQARHQEKKICAVGTTTLRALESAALADGSIQAGKGETQLFILPGFQFRVINRLLTNFHLPRSTLLLLVSAFAGIANIRMAYQNAIKSQYRFFSYGDAMLLDCHHPIDVFTS